MTRRVHRPIAWIAALLLGLAALVAQGVLSPSRAAVDSLRPVVLDSGHIDLFELTYDQDAGHLDLKVKDDTALYDPDIAYREPEEVTVAVDATLAELTFGEDDLPEGFEFIPRNQPFYLLEQSQQHGLPWPGWSTERLLGSLPEGVTIPYDWGSVEFAVDVEGPGDVVTFQSAPDGTPTNRFIDTTDDEPDVIVAGSSIHYHTAWMFTELGDYELTVTPSAYPSYPSRADPLTGPAHSYHFRVAPRPPTVTDPDSFTYTVSDGVATVTGGPCEGGTLTIPGTLGGAPVAAIDDGGGSGMFAGCDLTSVVFPDTVTRIGDEVFNSNRLASLTLPASLTAIGYRAFWQNRLTSLVVPDSVTTIGDQAFPLNWDLASVDLGDSVTTIGEYAFGFAPLTSLTIPASVTSIGTGAFDTVAPGVVVRFEGDAPSTDDSFPEGQPVCHLPGATGFDVAPFGTRYAVSVCPGTDPEPGPPDPSQRVVVALPANAGALVVSVDPEDHTVQMSDFEMSTSGDRWTSAGALRPVTVTDTRAGAPGWTVAGQVGDFSAGAGVDLAGKYLGWFPEVAEQPASGGVAAGGVVTPGFTAGDGLAVASPLAVAPIGSGFGTSRLGAGLVIEAPTTLLPGSYQATITFTAI